MQNKPLRALLLSAGFGTRLRPLTLDTPKCLVEVNGKSMLEDWIEKLEIINTQKVLINTHYLHEKVNKFLKTQKYRKIKIDISYEQKILGTAGTLISNYKFFEKSIGLLIHSDNFSTFDLNHLINAHINRPRKCIITMLTFNTANPTSCGIIKLNSENIVKEFFEKKENPPGNLANGAVYVFDNEFLYWILDNYPNAHDFSTEIIPQLLGKIYTYHTNKPLIDIGNLNALEDARNLAKLLKKDNNL